MNKTKTSFFRLGAILLIGFLAATGIEIHRRSKRPARAPEAIQRQGYNHIRNIIETIEPTPFGLSVRGQTLISKIRQMMSNRSIIFTHQIKQVGTYRSEVLGPNTMYVKVLKNGESVFALVPDDQIAGAVFHEAVHAVKGGDSSIEEECDGYAAGLTASHIILGEDIPTPLLIDGKPAFLFIQQQYSDLGHQPDYIPVGETPGWLSEVIGLTQEPIILPLGP